MVKLRLIRVGRKNDPHFRVVAQDIRRAPKGSYLELLGTYSPAQKRRVLKKERIEEWLSKGAKPTDTVWNMLVAENIVKGKKIAVHAKAKKKKGEEQAVEAPKAQEAPKDEQAPKPEEKIRQLAKEETKAEVKPEEKAPEKPQEPKAKKVKKEEEKKPEKEKVKEDKKKEPESKT